MTVLDHPAPRALPSIGAHAMPAELPANRAAGWRPTARRSVLLIHDMQNYFLRPYPAGSSPLAELLANTVAVRETCAALGVPVVYTLQRGAARPGERGLLNDFWGPGMSADPADTSIPAALAPRPGDIQLTKLRYSALFGTDLLDRLHAAGRDQLIICGVYAHIGVLATAVDAFMNDIQAFVLGDGVADFSPGHHQMAMTHVAQRCGQVLTTAAAIAALRSSSL
ncbi:isochorismatase family protein [Nonomuraea sp. NPDC050556]|uniref:isochorismatase family protein n=1 Tax=Nonomuraea sp. NPDC050556 TaxID=3364369 RepID=UPI0037909174